MDDRLERKIQFEISQVDKLLVNSGPLFDVCKIKVPDFIEISAAAMVLHSFYNGIENILILIFKHYDTILPDGNKWHLELLEKSFSPNKNRTQIFLDEIQLKMEEYLKFRHFIRHSYGFQLEWERMKELINQVELFWGKVKENIHTFMENN